MSNEDVEYVVKQSLDVCQRKQPKGWAKVAASGSIMFVDIEADTVIALVKSVVEVSLGRFFPTGQSESQPRTSSGFRSRIYGLGRGLAHAPRA